MQEKKAYIEHYGMWSIPVAVHHVLCSDGKRRYARITSQSQDAWSIPASVQVKGKSVSGFITSGPNHDGDLIFHAFTNKKNGNLLP